MMKSGGGVLVVAAAQLLVGLCMLGIYEGENLPLAVDTDVSSQLNA